MPHAIFTVCATPDVTAAVTMACSKAPELQPVDRFERYFSGEYRPQLSAMLKAAPGAIALVDCDLHPELALETMRRLRKMGFKRLDVIGLATEEADGYLLRAMRAGCNDFRIKPLDPEYLRELLLELQRAQAAEAAGRTPDEGSVLSVYGVKGGVGATTLAVHLAHELVRDHDKRVLLIDDHYELGHVALHLGMTDGEYHFSDLVRNVRRLDADLLKGMVAKHSSGMDVLTSPDVCSSACPTTAEDVQTIFEFLRRQYDYVIVDSSINYVDVAPAIMQASDEVYLISTSDVASLRDLARRVGRLGEMDDAAGKLRIIINRSTSMDAKLPEQIESAIHLPVWLSVPNHYQELQRAINAGEPLPAQKRSGFTQGITEWAGKLTGEEKSAEATGGKPARRLMFWRPQPSAS